MALQDFENYLASIITVENRVDEAMNYALLNGGKRLRPLILFAMLKDFGLNEEFGYECGVAIEMIHTYSLIHDDLPAMDNDDLRRGKPSTHKQFDEATAILAGDGLLTKAFEVICSPDYTNNQIKELVHVLAVYSGHLGMVKGQCLDLSYEGKENITIDELVEMEKYKTGDLLSAPFVCATVLANRIDLVYPLDEIGHKLGLAFQIQDDIFDYTKTSEELGKSTSDSINHKTTFYTLLGEEEANEMCKSLFDEVINDLNGFDIELNNTVDLVKSIYKRNK